MFDFVARHLDSVDGVVFDFGGVVAEAPGDDWPLYAFMAKAGVSMEAVKRGNAMHRNDADGGWISFEEMYRRILAENGAVEPYEGFCAEAAAIDAEGWTHLVPATYELMRELKALGKKLGLLSNMSIFFYDNYYLVKAAHVHAIIDVETISAKLLMTKPGREIYDACSKAMGIPPSRLLFLDDIPANVEAARRYGWKSEAYDFRAADRADSR